MGTETKIINKLKVYRIIETVAIKLESVQWQTIVLGVSACAYKGGVPRAVSRWVVSRRRLTRAYTTRTSGAFILGIEEVNTLYHVTDIKHALTAAFEC